MDVHLKENTPFDKTITKDTASASIAALPRDTIPTGIVLDTDTGRIHGTPRNIPDSGSSFRVAFAQIMDDKVKTTEVTFMVDPSRPPVWGRDLTYFYNSTAISINLSTFVTGKSPITFSVQGTAPSWFTLTGSMITGTNPRTALTDITIRATNDDGFTDRRFTFGRATDVASTWGTGVWGTFVWGQ